MLKAKLIVVGGDAKAKEVDLKLPTVIGRGREVSLTLPHPLVSRKHTELFEKDGYLFVKDLGSLNGTYVNNRRIESEQRLAPNQLLTLGNVTFRAVYDAEENADVTGSSILIGNPNSDTKDTSNEKEETVNFDRIDESHSVEAIKDRVREPLKTQAVDAEKVAVRNPVEAKLASSDASKNKADAKSVTENSSDGKLETPSDIFSGDEDFLSPEKSISLSSLGSLPPVSPSVSVLGTAFEMDDQPHREAIESVDLDVSGDVGAGDSDVSEKALGSFLKKLPR